MCNSSWNTKRSKSSLKVLFFHPKIGLKYASKRSWGKASLSVNSKDKAAPVSQVLVQNITRETAFFSQEWH